jgi:hypothetical protein
VEERVHDELTYALQVDEPHVDGRRSGDTVLGGSRVDRLIDRIADPMDPLALVPKPRLRNLERLCMHVADRPGAFVECGVARGGCLALMSALGGPHRRVWGFDSFEGLPPLTEEDEGSGVYWVGVVCAGPSGMRAVADTFATLGIPSDNVRLVKGWFEETLPGWVDTIGEIALLRLDSDWYRSTRYCLEMFYESVEPGGVVIIDDYLTFTGCRRAVDEFRASRHIETTLHVTDPDGEVYWLK